MNFDKLITPILLTGLLCGPSNAAMARVNAADCKLLLVGSQFYGTLQYTDCANRSQRLPFDKTPHLVRPLAVKAGSTVYANDDWFLPQFRFHHHFPIENGKNLLVCDQKTCNLGPAPSNCKPIDVIYENAHYWVAVNYTACGGIKTSESIPTGGATLMAQEGTEVLMGPVSTATQNYLNYGKGKTLVGSNGLNITCWGWEGGKGEKTGCKTY